MLELGKNIEACVFLQQSIDLDPEALYTPCGETSMATTTETISLVGCGVITDLVIVPLDDRSAAMGAISFARSFTSIATRSRHGAHGPGESELQLDFRSTPDRVLSAHTPAAHTERRRRIATVPSSFQMLYPLLGPCHDSRR
jgi:hypothetical protein